VTYRIRTGSRRRSTLIAAAAIGVTVLTGGALAAFAASAEGPVAVVGDREISADEIRFQMGLLESGVENAVSAGRIPAADAEQELRERALQQSLRDAQLFILARENGLIDFDDFDGFRDALAEENAVRADALAAGEIVYGTTEFSAAEYYQRTLTLLRTELTGLLSAEDGPLHVQEADVRAAFDADPAAWAAQATTWQVRSLILPTVASEDPACMSALAASPADLVAVESACGVTATPMTIDGSADLPAGSPVTQVLASVQDLAPGATSDPVVADDGIHLYQLVSSTSDADAAYELYADRIRSVVLEDRLDGYLDDLVSTASPDTDEALLSTIEPKD